MYKLILTIRYLLKRRITHFAIAAVALCVFIVVVVMTIMSGLVLSFKQKNHAFFGDCVVGSESLVGFPHYEEFVEVLERSDLVVGVSPVVKNYALFSIGGYDFRRGVEVMGIDPVRHSRTTNFAQTLQYHKNVLETVFQAPYDANALGCITGMDVFLLRDEQGRYAAGPRPLRLAMTLTCFPLNARGAPAGAGSSPVKSQGFFHSDHSRSGIARVDDATVYIPLEQAQLLCMSGVNKRVNAIYVKFRPGTDVRQGTDRVAGLWQQFRQTKQEAPDGFLLDTVRVQDWKEYRRAVIAPQEKEQVLLSLMFILVGVTTVFIVFVVFYMIISNKRKDIGVLKSVGASDGGILALFSGFATAVGFLGASVGAVLGWLFLAKINDIERWMYEHFGFQLWDRTIYVIDDIPNHLEAHVLATIILSAVASCVIGALVPSYLAARLRPVETLHAART